MQLHKLACSHMSLHAVPWACMQFPELSGSSMSLHAVSWACMQFLSLSEQLTKISQCLFFIDPWQVADLKGLRTFTVEESRTSRNDPLLRRRTDSVEDLENYTVATLLNNRYFFQDQEKRGSFHLLATLLTTLTCDWQIVCSELLWLPQSQSCHPEIWW